MFKFIRNSKITRGLALYFCFSLVFQLISPTVALALTSGPGQEEFASFEPASTTDMVDLYTGDYNYNIPLLSVPGPNGGYPINIAYHSGIGMEQEASWVGLGWTLNVGAITRNLRGLPDDFNGDPVVKTQHIKENVTASFNVPHGAYNEFIGFPSAGGTGVSNDFALYYNNYKGLGMRYTFSATGSGDASPLGLAISNDSQNGMGIGLSFSPGNAFAASSTVGGFGLGANYNSRQGLQSFNFTSKGISVGGSNLPSSTLSFATVFGVPHTTMQTKSTTVPFKLRLPIASTLFRFQAPYPIQGSVYTSKVEGNGVDNVPATGYLNTNNDIHAMKDFSRDEIMYSKKIPHLATSSFTYDLYTQTGQGTGSMFRPYLNTFGVLNDPQKISKDNIRGLGLEAGVGVSDPPPGTDVHAGVDFDYGDGQSSSGPWTQIESKKDWGDKFDDLINWKSSNSNTDYEPYYFQAIGEKTGYHTTDDQLKDFGNDKAVRLHIKKETSDHNWLTRHFKTDDALLYSEASGVSSSFDGITQTKQKSTQKRTKRASSIETLTTAQAQEYGFSKNVQYRDVTGSAILPCHTAPTGTVVSKDFTKSSHHISEISMLQSDGMRYVYGLPAYNNKQVDNVFAVTEDPSNINFSETDVHTGGAQNYGGINVTGTHDEYVSKNELPAYAHSWMLTTVLSADYLDVTGNGPTDDDFGYWVKFNYKKTAANYMWRIPYSKANYIDGYKSDPDDNKGSYTYGEKDIYVLESIETKTHIAVFETSDRKDSHEAAGEYSTGTGAAARGPQTMQKLDRIKLYTKHEYAQTTPIPTKVINFEYSYDLCPNVPNNDPTSPIDVTGCTTSPDVNSKHGKLTLTKLYFTYQTSNRGMMSPYIFNYGDINDAQDNPDYNKLNMDRWGNFKNNDVYASTNYPYIDHPYTDQPDYSSGAPAVRAAPWTLKQISLPTGGTLKIDYESDDYAYVENKQATRMYDICALDKPASSSFPFDLAGTSRGVTGPVDRPTEGSGSDGGLNRVYFKLEQPIYNTLLNMGVTTSSYNDWFKKLYLENLQGGYVYFSTYAYLKKEGTSKEIYDYVKGYAEIDWTGAYGVISVNSLGASISTGSGTTDYGYFTLKNKKLSSPVNTTGMWVNPFTLAAIQHLRANRQELIYSAIPYGASGSPMAQITNLVAVLPANLTDLMASTIGFNNWAYQLGWGQKIKLNGYSTIKLCAPQYKKIGGGVRVQKITLNDNWKNDPAVAQNSSYGQKYDYTKTTMINGAQVTISSGVAYEPQVGKEESALRYPINYVNSIPLHGPYNLFMEEPLMDDYYPGANVGYSQVTVTSIAPDEATNENALNTLQYSAAPITVNEFYTPKDFPVIVDKTDMNPGQPIKIPLMVPGILTNFTTRQAKSQGYSVILNDMAGKPKAVTTKTRTGDQIISRQKFIYNTEDVYNEDAINQLSAKVQTLELDPTDGKAKYITSVVGQTHDMFVDMNEDAQDMKSFGLQTNFDFQYNPTAIFAIMLMPIPTVKVDHTSLRTAVFNKIINRTGILKKVETTTNQSTIITENLAYDIETGEPLLTKVTNEFKDPVYNFSYPGHWYYPNMGGAYQNFGMAIAPPAGYSAFVSDATTHYLDVSSIVTGGRKASDYFAKGDLLFASAGSSSGQYTVFSIDDATSSILLMNSSGYLFPVSTSVSSLKVLHSGFKNMQATKVGSMVFKKLNTTYVDYDPTNDAGTKDTVLADIFYSDLKDDKIINASAVEYGNDWQVFCGPKGTWTTTCVCGLNQNAYDFLGMMKSINASGQLFSEDVQLHDMVTNVNSNGFTNTLLNTSPKLLGIKTTELAGSGTKKLYYQGYASGIDLDVLIYHDPTDNVVDGDFAKADCHVRLVLPTGESWDDVLSFTDITAGAATGGDECVAPSSVHLQLMKKDGTSVTASVGVVSSCSVTPCGTCWTFEDCYTNTIPDYSCGIQVGDPVNPYWAGMKGMWRPLASYAYNTARTQNDNIKEDGVFTDFVRFPWEDPSLKDAKWIKATTVTKYSPYGFELENKDALGNFSSALYGYNQALVTAIGSNAEYKELAVANFEDYPLGCTDNHFKFTGYEADVTNAQAHTGLYSILAAPSSSVYVQSTIGGGCAYAPIDDKSNPTTPVAVDGKYAVHITNSCDCLGEFSPEAGKKYVASVWTKEIASSGPALLGVTNYTAPQLKITITLSSGGPTVYTFTPQGNVIDGWQQIFNSFDIPSNATGIKVELANTLSNKNVFFDDIRLHPFNGNMVSYVYDPITLKTLAELDANNYATIYVYDDEGHLNKVKKETVEGIKTIKEGRENTKKYNE